MITLFISSKCPDTEAALVAFKQSNIEYELVDITDSMKNLKRFLHFRDSSPFFKATKRANNVGVPSIMINEGKAFYLYKEGMDIEFLNQYEKK